MLQLLLHLIFSLQLLRLQVATPLSLTTAASFLAGGPDARLSNSSNIRCQRDPR